MGAPKLKPSNERPYTYADYRKWNGEFRCELYEGVVMMCPAPNRRHQDIVGEIFYQLKTHLKGKTCQVFIAPFDVRLTQLSVADDQIYTVLQPDVSVYCDPAKLDERGGNGAPDLVIEVASPATTRRDQTFKLKLYEKNGVREYWIVFPDDRLIHARVLAADGQYGRMRIITDEDTAAPETLPGMVFDLLAAFGPPPPDETTLPPGAVIDPERRI